MKKENKEKELVMSWLGISGQFSNLELVIYACAKLGVPAKGDVKPDIQLKNISRIIPMVMDCSKLKHKTKASFYDSRAWKILRYHAIEQHGNKCHCCGASPSDGITIHVDHIKPRSKHPELSLDITNLQILCEDCNTAKLNQWYTDWRP